ncbi:MAG TPA: YjbQ family protein [Firmicutes bacterium]|nr:YjbQ family protein [Bacillota bacterium]
MFQRLTVRTTQASECIDITAALERIVAASGVEDGVLFAYVPHTTAGITLNENADPSVRADIEQALARLVPALASYAHAEGNSAAHIKASLVGSSVTILVSGGKLALGRWQGAFFCEFDGPRTREVLVRVAGLP